MTGKEILQQIPPTDLSDPFPSSDFDDWAESYDQDVLVGGFPFDGYAQVLETALRLADCMPGQSILDLGIGTGNLAERFAHRGCLISGLDYSVRMLELARRKLPQSVLLQADLRQDLPRELGGPYDRIVSAYVFHHFELPFKIALLVRLMQLLKSNGRMVIADLAFSDRLTMASVRKKVGPAWEDEYYWIADETLPELARVGLVASFVSVSSCAGVFVIPKP